MIKKPLFGRKRRENCSVAIIINAYYSAPQYITQSLRLKEEFEKLGATADIVRNDGFFGRIDNNDIKTYFGNYSARVFLDKDKYLSEMLEISGITVFNSHKTIVDCDDQDDHVHSPCGQWRYDAENSAGAFVLQSLRTDTRANHCDYRKSAGLSAGG